MSLSLDGFVAGPDQSREHPLGKRGGELHGWHLGDERANEADIDELTLDITPVLLGSGERIFDGVESLGLEPVEVLHSPLATHIRYRRTS